ncbi:MAG: hypothetical protein WC378_19815 [Opitutaceae bacterium]|jgi:hypothetical protein
MATVTDNVIIPLADFVLPRDFAWRVRFIAAVDEQLRRLRSTGHFEPPRFFGYFFQGDHPVGVTGNWVVSLDSLPLLLSLPPMIDRMTKGQYSICSDSADVVPDFLLIHDSLSGSCWLWRFGYGLRFVEAVEPVGVDKDIYLGP